MDRVRVLSVLLLCSLSAAELLDNEIPEEGLSGPDFANVEQPQPSELQSSERWPPDLQAVLRDVTAQLSENRLMIRQLQADNQAQVAELRSLKSRTSTAENLLDALREHKSVARVAFSASLRTSGSEHIGPFSSYTTLVFKHLFFNLGNAYNPNTGMFRAPVRGAYHFEFYCIGAGPVPAAVGLVKNGNHVVLAHESQSGEWGTTANAVTLFLDPGDSVFLQLWPNRRIFDSGNHYSTFSGRLLFTL